MDISNLPIIDWDLGTKLAGNKKELAEEILTLLMQSLAQEIDSINQSFHQKNYLYLQQNIHKLHGATCYCGVPRLRLLLSKLETDLKSNIMDGLPFLLGQLNEEVGVLAEHHLRYKENNTVR